MRSQGSDPGGVSSGGNSRCDQKSDERRGLARKSRGLAGTRAGVQHARSAWYRGVEELDFLHFFSFLKVIGSNNALGRPLDRIGRKNCKTLRGASKLSFDLSRPGAD